MKQNSGHNLREFQKNYEQFYLHKQYNGNNMIKSNPTNITLKTTGTYLTVNR